MLDVIYLVLMVTFVVLDVMFSWSMMEKRGRGYIVEVEKIAFQVEADLLKD